MCYSASEPVSRKTAICDPVIFARLPLFLCVVLQLSVVAAGTEADELSHELPQPAKENLDYTRYERIRDEGLTHSHVMDSRPLSWMPLARALPARPTCAGPMSGHATNWPRWVAAT